MNSGVKRIAAIVMRLAVLAGIFFGIAGSVPAKADGTWTFVDGGGANGINYNPAYLARYPSVAVWNDELYVAWQEDDIAATDTYLRVKKFDGTTWSFVDGGGAAGLTPGVPASANPAFFYTQGNEHISLAVYNGHLYAAFLAYLNDGQSRILVRRYGGGSTWAPVDNGHPFDEYNGESYAPAEIDRGHISVLATNDVYDPVLAAGEEDGTPYLYLAWRESPNGVSVQHVRVARYDETAADNKWVMVGGGGANGLNYDPAKETYELGLAEGGGAIYATWNEKLGPDTSYTYQVHVKKRTPDGGWSWISQVDGLAGYGINRMQQASAPITAGLSYHGSNLYAIWSDRTYTNGTITRNQIRLARYDNAGSAWTFVDSGSSVIGPDGKGLNWDCTMNATEPPFVTALNDTFYAVWCELATVATSTNRRQVRVAGLAGTTKTFLDGNALTGLNYDNLQSASRPCLAIYQGDLYAVWQEDTSTYGTGELRVKQLELPAETVSTSGPESGTYRTGSNLDFVVDFSKNVTVTGTPLLPITMETGGTVNAAYLSGSGSSSLVFRYTVQAGQEDTDGVALGAAIDPNGGTIRGGSGLDAVLTLHNIASTAGVLVDGIGPTVTLSTTASNPTTVSPIPVTITFNEAVTGFTAEDIVVTNGTAGDLDGDGANYDAEITPTAPGTVTIGIAAGAAQNAEGEGNVAAEPLSLTFAPEARSVTGLSIAQPVTGTVHLTWTNPDSCWDKTVVVRKQGGFPLDPTDGILVCQGMAAETYDPDLPADIYYYAVYGSYYGVYAAPALVCIATTASSKIRQTFQPGDGGASTLRAAQSWHGTSYTAWNGAELPLGYGASGAQAGVWLHYRDLVGSLPGQIPALSRIVSARLVLHIKRYEPSAHLNQPYTIMIYRVPEATGLGAPYFGTADGIRTGLDWAYRDHRLGLNRPWAVGVSDIADALGSALDAVEFIPAVCLADGCHELSLDVTAAVKAWVGEGEDAQANQGFFLVIEDGSPGDMVVFDGATAAAGRPLLEVVYSTVTGADLSGPAASVTGLTAVPGAGQIALSWTNPASDPDYAGVRVVRRIGRTPFNAYDGDQVYDGPASSLTDTGLADGAVYYYAVFTYDSNRNYGPKAWVRAAPGTPVAPALTATAGTNRIDLSWTEPAGSTGTSPYVLYRSDGAEVRRIELGHMTSYIDFSVEAKTYTYWAAALNENGEGQPSARKSATPTIDTAPPVTPGIPVATAITNTAITLAWDDNTTNETGYAIEHSSDGGANWTAAGTVGFDVTTFTDTGLLPATTYLYRIRTVRGAQYSDWIESDTIATTAAPLSPANLAWTVISAGRVNLSWTDRATNETGYRVDVCGADGTVLWSVDLAADATSCSVTGLAPGTSYIMKVSAVNRLPDGTLLEGTAETEIVITNADPKGDLFI